ncbi:hypothetical protein ACQ4LE_007876 [Meloidogyne hapla]|uniref:Uncharacterized protein n=1 Tax=Meloidogyne hapla TaxID=6305 RepID=A0A1I8B768_MELHA
MLSKRIIYISQSPLKLIKFQNSSSAAVPDVEEPAQQQPKQIIKLNKENSFPTHFAPSRGIGRPIYSLIPGPKGELLADYVLFEETMKRQRVPWLCYYKMTSEERTIYIKHFKAIEARKLWYKCPFTGFIIDTISKLLFNGRCCGNGCRHCPYQLEGCNEEIKKSLVWNGAYYV